MVPLANEVAGSVCMPLSERYCDSCSQGSAWLPGGHAWYAEGMHCVAMFTQWLLQGVWSAGGHAWLGECVMVARRHAWLQGACVVSEGHALCCCGGVWIRRDMHP